jgi:hypothetical protein
MVNLGGKMKKLLLISTLALSTSLFAAQEVPLEQQIGSVTVEEVQSFDGSLIMNGGSLGGLMNTQQVGYASSARVNGNGEGDQWTPPPRTIDDRLNTAGTVISVARDVVALGESIYELAQKGKPTNTSEYAPISVVPRDPETKEYIEPFDLENFSFPVEKNYVFKLKDGKGKEAIVFNYKVLYSYGGSYNGAGKYLTGVIIIPGSIKTSYGWDFSSSMKLSGVMNHGTKENPVAGIVVTVKYNIGSWSKAYEKNDTIHITGRGEYKHLSL